MTGGRWFWARARRRRIAALSLAFSCAPTSAGAAAPASALAQPFRLVWSSSAGCGPANTFLAELEARTALLREAAESEHAITLIVETFRSQSGVRGQLTVQKPDGDLSVREVPGSSCQEVQSAMALIAALMVDPLAGSAERTARWERDEAAMTPNHGPESARPTYSLRLEQRLTARTALAPRLTWGEAVGGTLTAEANGLRPSLALSAIHAQNTTSVAQGSAELDWTAGQLTLCPAGLRTSPAWDLRACGELQLGRLRGVGFETARPATKAILWSSAGLELQARYQLLGPLWLGWEGSLTFPFTHARFYLEPRQTLHQVPAWDLSFGIGLGLRFL